MRSGKRMWLMDMGMPLRGKNRSEWGKMVQKVLENLYTVTSKKDRL